MADNVTLNSMSGGNTVAADEVTDGTLGTVKVQYVKLMDGTLDGTTKGGIDATYGLKVDVARSANVVLGTGANVVGAVTQSGTWNVGISAGSAVIGKLMSNSGTTIGTGSSSPSTTATQIVASASTRRSVTITNTGSITVNIGGSSVTTSTGIPLSAGSSVTISDAANSAIYGIVSSGTGTLAYMTESD